MKILPKEISSPLKHENITHQALGSTSGNDYNPDSMSVIIMLKKLQILDKAVYWKTWCNTVKLSEMSLIISLEPLNPPISQFCWLERTMEELQLMKGREAVTREFTVNLIWAPCPQVTWQWHSSIAVINPLLPIDIYPFVCSFSLQWRSSRPKQYHNKGSDQSDEWWDCAENGYHQSAQLYSRSLSVNTLKKKKKKIHIHFFVSWPDQPHHKHNIQNEILS